MKKCVLIFGLLVSCLVCAESQPPAEVILGFVSDSTGVTFQVESYGCTDKSDFIVRQLETSPVQVLLNRVQPDNCEAYAPYGILIKFTYKELGQRAGTEFEVTNQIERRITVF